MTDDELTHALRAAEAIYRSAQGIADEKREERNKLVRAALRKKWTHARIAEVTGLTRGRINQLR